MKEADKPLWYAIYEAFPPKEEPKFLPKTCDNPIRPIIYEEDYIRAKFYKNCKQEFPVIDLNKQSGLMGIAMKLEMDKKIMAGLDEQIAEETVIEEMRDTLKIVKRI